MSQIVYTTDGPIIDQFLLSDAFIVGIRGPIGSGKSTACVMKLVRGFQKQKPGPDGIKRRRSAIIRNTYPELKTTTIKTWHQWVPPEVGKWTDQGPPTHRIKDERSDWEVLFVALDRPEDVRKLLSMELSDAWINEAREIPKAVLDGLTGRVGRFPRQADGGATDPQVIMDTNSPDSDHWWAKMAEFPDIEMEQQNKDLEAELHRIGSLRPDQPLFRFYSQPGGRSADAENTKYLDPGYYLKVMAGKGQDWIKVYVDAEYGFVQEGKPVYPEYRDSTHCQPFQIRRDLPLHIGIDFGLTPAAVFGQRMPNSSWHWIGELVSEDMGARAFGELLGQVIRTKYAGMAIGSITGDPAGEARSQTDETTPFEILRAVGIMAQPAPTNDWTKRRESVAYYLNRITDGQPALLIHPDAQRLRKAMAGGYHYRRKQVSGYEIYNEVPDKDMHSHVADAAQYLMLGAGEHRTIVRRDADLPRSNRPRFAVLE